MQHSTILLGAALAVTGTACANEVTVQNDSLIDTSSGTIELGFVSGEKAASWLTSPCDGNIVAAQVLWASGHQPPEPPEIENSIEIFRSGVFPTPGALAQSIDAPQMNDGFLNEFRYLDDKSTIPLIVPVSQGETFVLALGFDHSPVATGTSTVIDSGLTPNRNAIYADVGGNFMWFSNAIFPVNGDWVIRAVVDCQTAPTDADVSVSMSASPTTYTAGSSLQYTIIVSNAGPANVGSATLVDSFPAAFQTPSWSCATSGGAICPAGGSGNIVGSANLPSGGSVTFLVTGTVAPGTTGLLSNSMTAVVNPPATDPSGTNNTATLDLSAATNDLIFANGFDPATALLATVSSRAMALSKSRR